MTTLAQENIKVDTLPNKSFKNTTFDKPTKGAQKETHGVLANLTNNLRKSNPSKSTMVKATAVPVAKGSRTTKPLKRGLVEEEKGGRKKLKSDIIMADTEEVEEWEDIDTLDGGDPQAVAEYVNEIYEMMMNKERKDHIKPGFMGNQSEITDKMRSILVDWLVEVHRMFKLLPETLFLTVFIIDHYIELKKIPRDKLQLVGITSMLIASKYEEIYAPECNDFVYIADGAYSKDQILTMEQTLLNTLDFNLSSPSPLHFLRRYSKAAGSDYQLHTICKLIIELMLLDSKMLKFLPSQIAAGAVYLARVFSKKTPWTNTLTHYTTYDEMEILEVATEMNEHLKRSQKSSLKAIKKKYALPKYGSINTIPVIEDLSRT